MDSYYRKPFQSFTILIPNFSDHSVTFELKCTYENVNNQSMTTSKRALLKLRQPRFMTCTSI